MKIISKNKDFYDYLVGIYGEDDKLVYDRRKTYANDLLCPLNHLNSTTKKVAWHSLLWIGDELVHIFATNKNEVFTSFDVENIDDLFGKTFIDIWDGVELTLKTGEKLYFFTEFNVDVIFQHHQLAKQTYINRENSPIFRYLCNHFLTADYLEATHREMLQTGQDFKISPILLVYLDEGKKSAFGKNSSVTLPTSLAEHLRKRKIQINGKWEEVYRHDYRLWVNPILQEQGIFLDPVFVWQNISEYLGRLRTEQEITPPMSNNEKIVSKGFDKKRSFRPKIKK